MTEQRLNQGNPSMTMPATAKHSSSERGSSEFQPGSVEELSGLIQTSARSGRAIRTGECSAIEQSQLSIVAGKPVDRVSLQNLNSVVDYPARDMTITVEAGMTVGQLREVLRSESQQLPLDTHSNTVSIGSLVAGDHSGPRRTGYGTVRDYLIGMEAVDGRGRIFHAGGRVVKNVAGYDFCRLAAGSRGQIGVLTRLTFKLKPCPASAAIAVVGCPTLKILEQVLNRLNLSATRPTILDVLNPAAMKSVQTPDSSSMSPRGLNAFDIDGHAAFILAGFEGTQSVCRWQLDSLREETQPDGCSFTEIPEQTPDTVYGLSQRITARQHSTPDSGWLFRLTVPPSSSVAAISLADPGSVEVFGRASHGSLYYRPASLSRPPECSLEASLREQLSHVVTDSHGVMSDLNSAVGKTTTNHSTLIRSLLKAFDPEGVFVS
ncbi:MAG: FAD-binding oxidoreductase [Planctomyces sp.]|nr:FAD-binding oxidoreductase [Planctomyces sp.]